MPNRVANILIVHFILATDTPSPHISVVGDSKSGSHSENNIDTGGGEKDAKSCKIVGWPLVIVPTKWINNYNVNMDTLYELTYICH